MNISASRRRFDCVILFRLRRGVVNVQTTYICEFDPRGNFFPAWIRAVNFRRTEARFRMTSSSSEPTPFRLVKPGKFDRHVLRCLFLELQLTTLWKRTDKSGASWLRLLRKTQHVQYWPDLTRRPRGRQRNLRVFSRPFLARASCDRLAKPLASVAFFKKNSGKAFQQISVSLSEAGRFPKRCFSWFPHLSTPSRGQLQTVE